MATSPLPTTISREAFASELLGLLESAYDLKGASGETAAELEAWWPEDQRHLATRRLRYTTGEGIPVDFLLIIDQESYAAILTARPSVSP